MRRHLTFDQKIEVVFRGAQDQTTPTAYLPLDADAITPLERLLTEGAQTSDGSRAVHGMRIAFQPPHAITFQSMPRLPRN